MASQTREQQIANSKGGVTDTVLSTDAPPFIYDPRVGDVVPIYIYNATTKNSPYAGAATGRRLSQAEEERYFKMIEAADPNARILADSQQGMDNQKAGNLASASANKSQQVFTDTKAKTPSGINLITSTLNLGSQGDQVKALQQYLQGLGYKNADGTPLKVDGIYGNNTKTAVSQFQSKNGLTADGVFGPKSLAKTKEITSTSTQANSAAPGSSTSGTKAPDDPSNMYNTATGILNPNYNPNANGNTFNTGDTSQDALLNELQNYIKMQQDAGLTINADLNFDQATLDKFLETAKKQVHPYYAQQIDTIKQDVLRAAPQILQNYESDVAGKEGQFQEKLGNARENYAGAGLAFSGQRAKEELGMEAGQNRDLSSLSQAYGNKLYDLGRGAEEKIGATNVNYDLGALRNYSANLGAGGSFTQGGTTTPYTAGGYSTGSLQYEEAAAQEARRQALAKTASESAVAGRSYQDLFA